jgi:16S rRNA U516 pseudouridylate synthase RsuA-like enzyme
MLFVVCLDNKRSINTFNIPLLSNASLEWTDGMAILKNSLRKKIAILFTWWLCEPFKFKLIHGLAPSKTPAERSVVILYNKPPNVITSHKSDDSRSTVYEEIESMRGFLPSDNTPTTPNQLDLNFEQATGIRSKLHAIGRLDADTSGLLLLTNDGRLLHHVTNPNAKTEEHEHYFVSTSTMTTTPIAPIINKTYRALIMGCHTEESLEPIKYGVDIGSDYITKPVDDLQIIEHPNHKSTIVLITISEGKNRQVRKMFHAIGSGVMKLQRTKIGEHLTLEGVQGKFNCGRICHYSSPSSSTTQTKQIILQ